MSSPARLLAPRALSLSLLSLSLLALAPAAWAVEPLDTFSFRAGGYISTFDSEVRADGEVSNGTPIELDRDLDLDQDNAIAFLSATWRPFDRHEFGLAYYQDDVSATRQLQRDIVFDDTVYPASGTVRSDFDVSAYELSYVWWAASHDNWAMGPRLGLVWYDIELSIALELDVDGNQTDGSISDSVSADLPGISPPTSATWMPMCCSRAGRWSGTRGNAWASGSTTPSATSMRRSMTPGSPAISTSATAACDWALPTGSDHDPLGGA